MSKRDKRRRMEQWRERRRPARPATTSGPGGAGGGSAREAAEGDSRLARMTRDHLDVLQSIELAIMHVYRADGSVDDLVVQAALEAGLAGSIPSDDRARRMVARMATMRSMHVGLPEGVWRDGLRVVLDSLREHSHLRPGARGYLQFVDGMVPDFAPGSSASEDGGKAFGQPSPSSVQGDAMTQTPTDRSAPVRLATGGAGEAGKWMALLAAFLGWMFDGLEMGLFPVVARPAITEMLGEGSKQIMPSITWITAAFLVGAAVGGLVFGWLGDRIGRVRAMVWSVLVYSVFSGLCGFAHTPLQFGGLRFLASLGMGGEWALGVALVMEIWPSASRPTLAGIIGTASNFGFALVGVLGYSLVSVVGWLERVLRDLGASDQTVAWLLGEVQVSTHSRSGWRLLVFLGAMPALLTFFIRIFVPESHRWQHAAATTPKNKVADIFAPGLARLTILGTLLAAVVLLGTWGSTQQIAPWASKLPGAHAQVNPLVVIWSGLGAVVGTLLAAWLAQLASRRISYFVMTLLSLLATQYLFRTQDHWSVQFQVWVFIVGGLTASFYGWLPLYLPELFPTRVRATAQGFAYNASRVLAAVGTVTSGTLVNVYFQDNFAKMCAVVSLVYIIGLVLIWFCPETKGKPLPE